MHVPTHILARLKRFDRHLTLKWDPTPGRWKVLRRNPVKPLTEPDLVCTWQDDKGRHLPLDNRLFRFLDACDMQRKFRNRDRRTWGDILNRELEEREEAGRLMREKMERDELERLEDGLKFVAKNDRRRIRPETVNP